MEFPIIVYKCPGLHFGPNGTTYSSVGVDNKQDLDEKISQGWHDSLVKAVDAFLNPSKPVDTQEENDDDSPVTREELELKARELGIKFDGRTSDKTLLKRIEETIGGQ